MFVLIGFLCYKKGVLVCMKCFMSKSESVKKVIVCDVYVDEEGNQTGQCAHDLADKMMGYVQRPCGGVCFETRLSLRGRCTRRIEMVPTSG